MSHQPSIMKSDSVPAQPSETQEQAESKIGLPSSVKKKLQWDDSEPQPNQVSQSCNHQGFCAMNEVKIEPEESCNLVDGKQHPCKGEAPSPSPAPKKAQWKLSAVKCEET